MTVMAKVLPLGGLAAAFAGPDREVALKVILSAPEESSPGDVSRRPWPGGSRGR